MAPQKAPMLPISAATVATAEPRSLVSVAIAAYETASVAVVGLGVSVPRRLCRTQRRWGEKGLAPAGVPGLR